MTEEQASIWAVWNLDHLFVADKIHDVIRRPAPIFSGRRAIDLIMEGRGDEVKQAYETVLMYMGGFINGR